jgi:gamma-glutamylcyclotransferase (GGCT)/AIG2-like uncharacterized protein YtfP
MSVRLFVYGSLMRGQRHHDRMRGAAFDGVARTANGFRLVSQGDYPALAAGGQGSVEGEVYRVSEALLAELDVFEGCPDLYQRDRIALADGSSAETYRIVAERAETLDEIAGGRWRGCDA